MQKITLLRMMFPLGVKHCWMFVAILLCGIFTDLCMCCQKRILLVTTIAVRCNFSQDTFLHNGTELCVSFVENKPHSECEVETKDLGNSRYSVVLKKTTLYKDDIILMTAPVQTPSCMPSKLYNQPVAGFVSSLCNCLGLGKVIKLRKTDFRRSGCCDKKGLAETSFNITVSSFKESCDIGIKIKKQCHKVTPTFPPVNYYVSLDNPTDIMNNLASLLEQKGNSNTTIAIGDIKGVIIKLHLKDQTNISLGFTENGDIQNLEDNNVLVTDYRLKVHIPKEASAMAVKRNGTFAGVLLFPGIYQDNPNSYLINNEMVGIEMGTEISNLSNTIDIHYINVDKKGNVPSCRSWDGKGKQMWITDGCQTKETNGNIMCQCSHLTFFAILMSPPPGNITSSDFRSLNYITSVGCGVSMFFLIVALFMHCLIRKGKASQATKILINLFVAMFTMNLSFLINQSVANIGNFSACVVMAVVMHYSLLATFTWFFMEALHLCFNLWKLPSGIKYYMTKICITGWVIPAVVVIALLAWKKYDILVIYTNDGNSAKMCWISDAAVHQGVNVGYYATVFIFTSSIFIITVRQIVQFNNTAGKTQDSSFTKTNTFSIMGLFILLGITWGFAFFSHGPLLIPSYYIFTILNSFQGFFLFIYYYNSSKIVEEDRGSSVSSSGSMATSNTAVTSPYQ